jgi:hypothetical protein
MCVLPGPVPGLHDPEMSDEPAIAPVVADAVRRACVVATGAALSFGALFAISTQFASIRAHSPWAEDPYDAVLSIAALVLPFVAAITCVRYLRWRRPGAIPVFAARQMLRGTAVALGLVWASVGACITALVLHTQADTWGSWLGWLLSPLAVTTIAAVNASSMLQSTWRLARPRPHPDGLTQGEREAEPDAIDDFAVLLEDVGNLVGRLAPALGSLFGAAGRDLNQAMSSRWGLRQHRILWCLATAIVFGICLSAWHLVVEGAPSTWSDTLVVGATLAAIGAAVVVASYTLLGDYLRLIRPQPSSEQRTEP